jgi:hypothetical protein
METVCSPNHRCQIRAAHGASQKRCSWFKKISSNIWKRFLLYQNSSCWRTGLSYFMPSCLPQTNYLPIQWETGFVSPGVKRTEKEGEYYGTICLYTGKVWPYLLWHRWWVWN